MDARPQCNLPSEAHCALSRGHGQGSGKRVRETGQGNGSENEISFTWFDGVRPPGLRSSIKDGVIGGVTTTDIHRAIDAVWRIESAKLIAGLTRIVRDVGAAEDLAQEALVVALEQWPQSGVPDNPGAWLMATAKHRAIDLLRRRKLLERKHEDLGREAAVREMEVPDLEAALDAMLDAGAGTRVATQPDTDDDLLRLVFIACHPVLSTEARVALTLRLLGGLTTDEIARAFLVSEPTIAQRIVRAKRTLAEKRVPFETPRGPELGARLASVLEVIYLVFNEGYSATAGDDWMRPALCEDALRLGRILAQLMPKEPEVHGLVALMEIQASRSRARVGPSGEPVLLFDQNRAHWDQLLIHRGLAALELAEGLGGARGLYALQAAIAACHARARTPEETDWARIVELYAELARIAPSPVVELNRAVALGMAFGPAAGLEIVDALNSEPALKDYHLLPSVRGDLLRKLGRFAEAGAEFKRAASLTRNARERDLLLERAAACVRGAPVR
jgi:RNA polymerase sigma-70 factor, ECF subfamily